MIIIKRSTISIFNKFQLALLYIFLISFAVMKSYSHEFWIEPIEYEINNNNLEAHLRVGQDFSGMVLMYNEADFEEFKILSGNKNKKEDVKGIIGDVPALKMQTKLQDLLIVYHETTDKFVNYKKFQKFKDFVIAKGREDLIEEHLKLGYPEEDFNESYRRYAKSLITVNGSKGSDKKTGLLFEFVLQDNPYELDNNKISATLFYKKKKLSNHQVEIFSRKDNVDFKKEKFFTNDQGVVTFEVEPGRDYLIDAVIIYPIKGDLDNKEPIWHSIWASTTFHVPEKNL